MKGIFRGALCAVALLLSICLVACANNTSNEPSLNINEVQTYEIGNFSITMQSGLNKVDDSRFDAYYKSDSMVFTEECKSKSSLPEEYKDISLLQYLKVCLYSVDKFDDSLIYKPTDTRAYAYASYVDKEKFYYVFAFEGANNFYCVNFVCWENEREVYEPAFVSWINSVKIVDDYVEEVENEPYAQNELLTDVDTYQKDCFTIKLKSGLEEGEFGGVGCSYVSEKVLFTVTRNDKEKLKECFGDVDLITYMQLCLSGVVFGYQLDVECLESQDNYILVGYTLTLNEEVKYYVAGAYEGESAFYCVNFVCADEDRAEYEPAFVSWARTAEITD